MLQKAILVSAHPDDEILWFSSVLDKVDAVVFCFLDCAFKPQWSTGRRKVLSNYPLENASNLGVEESGVFNDHNWISPKMTEFGMKIIGRRDVSIKYENNYHKLEYLLKNKLQDYDNVITHNPWGEYGNEEHIQTYRVIKSLQQKMKYEIWFSNYCSNKALTLMSKYSTMIDGEYRTFQTNKQLSKTIKDLYQNNGCWTWYDDWEWFEEESFIRDSLSSNAVEKYGRLFPLNLLKVKIKKKSRKFNLFGKFTANRFIK